MKDNGYIYSKYLNHNQETRWATREEIEASGTFVEFGKEGSAAGLPLLSNGSVGYVDAKDTHTLIFGSTGSKKTRLFGMPLLNFFAAAGESFIATDPKGELYIKTAGYVKSQGYNIVTINFRDLAKGDMWNPLHIPYKLYHEGRVDEATAMLNDFVTTIAEPILKNTKDSYWGEAASAFALGALLLIMECARPEEAHPASLASLCGRDYEDVLRDLTENMTDDSLCAINLKGVLACPDTTLRCIYSTLFSMVRIFVAQKNLSAKLSGNTIDMSTIGKQKTAVYIIVPDEKTTYHFLVTTFIKQVYETLIAEAQRTPDKRLPVRVNFVLDEFCNIPRIPDMPSMISAARSRNMRFYLIVQSYHQLKGKYGEDADTIKGNCDNWVFLTSKELSLLQEISALCGSNHLKGEGERKLISESELQRLSKEKGEALIMHARQYPIITEIADVDSYGAFSGYTAPEEPDAAFLRAQIFDIKTMHKRVNLGLCVYPFSKKWEEARYEGDEIEYLPPIESIEDAEAQAGFVPNTVVNPFSPKGKAGQIPTIQPPIPTEATESIRAKVEEMRRRMRELKAKRAGEANGGSVIYQPKPIDTSEIVLPESIEELSEQLAKNTHEVWSKTRLEQGWTFGETRDDEKRLHPCLVEYEALPEFEKQFDRNTAIETLKLIIKLGYKIETP